MPIYEYRCRQCDHRFEVLQRMGEGPAGLICPECGAEEPVKQLSTFASGGSSREKGVASPAGSCGGFT